MITVDFIEDKTAVGMFEKNARGVINWDSFEKLSYGKDVFKKCI